MPAVQSSFKMILLLAARSGTSTSYQVQQPHDFERCLLPALEEGYWKHWQRQLAGLVHGEGSTAFLPLNASQAWCFSATLLSAAPRSGCEARSGEDCMSGS